ncbi:universal stress protein [Streptomyces neyagawaensis]|uniref:universal stress protein n=1 Tax=Streptomyces neyagawaensis TaxID=42238 RepID=UPI0006E11E6C|nr:universal stress protein [Streptomyces neyagawaensis]MCL6735974.1 universal stress protein [Streptomyces neyagawaensis]MDE1686892.1 universal stress protein [Streptomyces neyagawaensis]
MRSPVVAGVDGSAESLAAVAWAAREAVRRDLPLHLVHVLDRRTRRREDEITRAAQRRLGRSHLTRAEQRARAECPDVRLSDEQLEGPAVTALVKAADQADTLVLGSRGLSGFTGFLVGSVALGVVARATRPVVLVRAGERAEDERLLPADGGDVEGTDERQPVGRGGVGGDDRGGASAGTGYRDVVVAVDLGDACDEVIEFAFEAARLRHARLRAVHAWCAAGPMGLGPGDIALVDRPRQGEEWQGFLDAVLRTWCDKYPDVEVLATVVEDRPRTALVRAASGASLLVVGHRLGDPTPGPRTGPVTHAVIHHVGCPVAVVPVL